MSETELTETLSEEALERLNDRYGFWRKGKCDRDVMCALNELVSHRQRLAAAEQRATESEARAERLLDALVQTQSELFDENESLITQVLRARMTVHRALDGQPIAPESVAAIIHANARLRCAAKHLLATVPRPEPNNRLDQANAYREVQSALTAPATQPDERAAAERAVIDKGRVWQAAEDRLRAEEERQGADDPDAYLALSNDAEDARDDLLCVLRALDATDGAAKEGGRSIGDDGRVNSSSH